MQQREGAGEREIAKQRGRGMAAGGAHFSCPTRATRPGEKWTGTATRPRLDRPRRGNEGKEDTSAVCTGVADSSAGEVAACVRNAGFRVARLRVENKSESNPTPKPSALRRNPQSLAAHRGWEGSAFRVQCLGFASRERVSRGMWR